MGNSASASGRHQEEIVDYGYLVPQGVCTGPIDWNHQIVTHLICERKLAPFYRPLEEYDPKWDDEQVLAARKEPPEADSNHNDSHAKSDANASKSANNKRSTSVKETTRHTEAMIYRGAVECPICFLYYPPNINHSRCCDQAICTECFVQIKRIEPTTTHLVSEPAACPYCVQDNFGVVYTPPPWRAGIGGGGSSSNADSKGPSVTLPSNAAHKRRQKSFGADSPEVVTTDRIRPDWEAKLAAVRAAVARRANRRIIMRQVGDRLIPVGITSGRVHPITEDGPAEGNDGAAPSSRRSRRRHQQAAQNHDFNQMLGTMGMGGQDLEELMIMEAMRLSLMEHEERQRREAQNRQREQNGEAVQSTDALQVPQVATSTSSIASHSTPSLAPTSSSMPNPSPLSRESHPLELSSVTPATLRNRTPSPSPAVFQPVVDRSLPPSSLSALDAAVLNATTTATALLGDRSPDATTPGEPSVASPPPTTVPNGTQLTAGVRPDAIDQS